MSDANTEGMNDLDTLIHSAERIIERAVRDHKLTALVALFSGGPDSVVATHIAAQHPLFRGCIHINTKTSPLSELASRAAVAKMDAFGWEYVVASPFLTYRQLVAKYGFPGPASHTMMYQYLKDRPIRQAKAEWLARIEQNDTRPAWLQPVGKPQKARIGFITGIRAEESERRSHTKPATMQEGTCWIAPILHWKQADRAPYLAAHAPATTETHSSRGGLGECDCAAYAKPGEIDLKCSHDLMGRYRTKLEQLAAVSRDLDLLEAEAGMREAADVMPEAFTVWGHGRNKAGAVPTPIEGVTICNDCSGQLTYDGSAVGEDMEYIVSLRTAMSTLEAAS